MQRGDDEEKKRKLKIESMFKSINCQRAERVEEGWKFIVNLEKTGAKE